jgi:hypothetical protein
MKRRKIRYPENRPKVIAAKIAVVLIIIGWGAWYIVQRGRMFMAMNCRVVYAQAMTARDSARVDRMVLRYGRMPHWVTCGEIRVDNWPPFAEQVAPLYPSRPAMREVPRMRAAEDTTRSR